MNITICGGGNMGHVCAGFFAAQDGVNVRVLTRRPECWSGSIVVTDPNGQCFVGDLDLVTDDPASVFLIAMDNEFQDLLCALGVRRGAIPTILDYYESRDAVSLYGLKFIHDLAHDRGVASPNIDRVFEWGMYLNSH